MSTALLRRADLDLTSGKAACVVWCLRADEPPPAKNTASPEAVRANRRPPSYSKRRYRSHVVMDPDTLFWPTEPRSFCLLACEKKRGRKDRACQDGFDHSVPPYQVRTATCLAQTFVRSLHGGGVPTHIHVPRGCTYGRSSRHRLSTDGKGLDLGPAPSHKPR
jgi:hypothetical protein